MKIVVRNPSHIRSPKYSEKKRQEEIRQCQREFRGEEVEQNRDLDQGFVLESFELTFSFKTFEQTELVSAHKVPGMEGTGTNH